MPTVDPEAFNLVLDNGDLKDLSTSFFKTASLTLWKLIGYQSGFCEHERN